MSLNSHSQDRHINIPRCIYSVCFLYTVYSHWRETGQFGKTSQRPNEMGSLGWLLEVSSGPVEDRRFLAYGRESLQRAFSLFSDVPLCARSIRGWLCLWSGLFWGRSSVFACQELSACVYRCVYWTPLCRRFKPVMLNSGLKAVPLCRKYGKGTISSLQGCHVKKAKQGSLFFPLPLFLALSTSSLSVYSVCLVSVYPCCSLIFSPAHTHTHTHTQQIQRLRCFESLPEGAKLLAHLLPAAL